RTALHDQRAPAGALAVEPAPDGARQQQPRETTQCRPQTHRPGVRADQLLGYRGGPVLQRRLLEVLHPIEPRGHPIAAAQHLARDLAVAALVGVEQRGYAEGRKPQQEQQRPGTGAQPWGEGPLPATRGCIDSHAKRDNALGVANLTLWIGTRKGAFALRADRQRRRWQL